MFFYMTRHVTCHVTQQGVVAQLCGSERQLWLIYLSICLSILSSFIQRLCKSSVTEHILASFSVLPSVLGSCPVCESFTSRGGCRISRIHLLSQRRAEVAGPWHGRVVPPLFSALLRLREVIVHGQVCYWRMIKECKSGVQKERKKSASWHTIKCILSSCSEGGGGGWMLIIQTMKTIKSSKNTGKIPFHCGSLRVGPVLHAHRSQTCVCRGVCNDDQWRSSFTYRIIPVSAFWGFSFFIFLQLVSLL